MRNVITIYKALGETPYQAILKFKKRFPEYMNVKISYAGPAVSYTHLSITSSFFPSLRIITLPCLVKHPSPAASRSRLT